MINTINEARTPGELAAWLRQWADGADASDHLDDNDARQLAEAVERVCALGNKEATMPGPELKPCPFCGGRAKRETARGFVVPPMHIVRCSKCGCMTTWMREDWRLAVSVWNRRAEKETK